MRRKVIAVICFLLGIFLCSYPLVSSQNEYHRQMTAVSTYKKSVEEKRNVETAWQEAKNYNAMLQKLNGGIVRQNIKQMLGEVPYEEILNLSGIGMMGVLEIPAINVNVPIYHGTKEEVLSIGAGHVEGTALPVGGKNNHCVLAGHRGLPSSKLFTRLDEMKTGDCFFLNVCGKTLAYQVEEIRVIRPENTEILEAETGKDLVSLITCTPYGLNTHRLVVTGKRAVYQREEKEKIQKNLPSIRELCFVLFPVVFFILGLRKVTIEVRRKKD